MPMIDAYIPEGALGAEAEARLMEELTTILIGHEGLDPANPRTRSSTWVLLHRVTTYQAGVRSKAPLYRVVPTVPEGQYTDEARAGLVRDVTAAIARAEGGDPAEVATRVWVFPTEIFDGGWGGRGVIRHLPDIMAYFGGADADAFRREGELRLASKRRGDIVAGLRTLLAALDAPAPQRRVMRPDAT
ncbi:MAG: Tautomerase enzyme [Pseudomonadota bacterium]